MVLRRDAGRKSELLRSLPYISHISIVAVISALDISKCAIRPETFKV